MRSKFITAVLLSFFIFSSAFSNEKGELKPSFKGKDKSRSKIEIKLLEVASGFTKPVDIQFVPGREDLIVVLEQRGVTKWYNLKSHKSGEWFKVSVTRSYEEGLLGLAFDPQFIKNGFFYLNYTTKRKKDRITRVSKWISPEKNKIEKSPPKELTTLLEVVQPFKNHNGGDLEFGPDGLLYIGLGDGGYFGDPYKNAQNKKVYLGKMLKLDTTIPKAKPEIYAIGLRNPWRYSFDQHKRLIVADVGQGKLEEIDIVEKGDNLGWNIKEGTQCYKPKVNCKKTGLKYPIFEYGRDDGGSVTGGYVYLGKKLSALNGKYVFGDFLSGKIWALEIPVDPSNKSQVFSLGKWPISISTFGRNPKGGLFVVDYSSGKIYKIN